MELPPYFENLAGYARFRPEGSPSPQDALMMSVAAITFAREQQISHLLVDITRLTGITPPTTLERYTAASAFAQAARGTVKVAVLVPAETVDPERFAVTVANNRGMNVNVFTSDAEALRWLLPDAIQETKDSP